MRMMRPLLIVFITVGIPFRAFCLPPDTRAADVLGIVRTILASGKDRMLSPVETDSVVKASNIDSTNVRMAAASALAFTASEEGRKALERLASDRDPSVAGIAEFSVLYRQTSGLSKEERLSIMSFQLGKSTHPWTRVMLVSSLGDQFRSAMVPLFLTVLEKEPDVLVRAELFFQIATNGNIAQLKMVRSLLAQEKQDFAGSFNEMTAFFLDSVSRNAIQRESIPTDIFLHDLIKSRIKKLESASPKR